MNIRDLKYVVTVAEEMSFGRAADKVFVSQPTISAQIKKLEDEIGVQIFERAQKKFLVTKVGGEIVEKARIILNEIAQIQKIANNSKDPFAGELLIGAFPTLSSYFFPKITLKIATKFPKLKLFLLEEKTEELLKKLKNGQIDAAFLAMPSENNEVSKNIYNSLNAEKIFTEDFLLAAPKKHPLAEKKTIRAEELKGMELMLLEDGHCLRNQALEVCSLVGAFEQQDFKATSLETLRQMVISGSGLTLIPQIAVNKADKISYIKIINAPKRTIGLYWRNGSVKKDLLGEISEISKNTFKINI